MTAAAEDVRARTLKSLADAAMARAEALGAELEGIWDAGGEPGPELVARFEGEVAETERLLLEYSLALPGTAGPS